MNERKQREIRLATDIIAKLLASENLKIIDGGTNVSYIDVIKREIHVIKFKAESPLNTESVRLTSLAHEVGHALFTPVDLLHQKIDESYPNLAPFINIVEDVRIERLIKNRFAGLHRIMNEGRILMYQNGVFSEQAISNPNDLEFINKFILAFKVGINNTNGLILSNVESCVLRYIELHATDKESVIKCAKLLYNLCEYKTLPPETLQKINESINSENNNDENSNESMDSDSSNGENSESDVESGDEASPSSVNEESSSELGDNDSDSKSNESENTSDENHSSINSINEMDEKDEKSSNEIDPNKILQVLLKISESLQDDDIKYNHEYENNILQTLDNMLQKHVDNHSRTATISKTFFSNNIIQMYEV